MSVLRFDPFRDPFREIDRLTNQMLSGTRTPASAPMDVWRSGDTYNVALDLPGIDPASIDVTVERGTVTIRAERQRGFAEGDQVLLAERPQGAFTRQLLLGEGVDQESLHANFQDGVLHLTIPVAQQAQPRRIEVGRNQAAVTSGVQGGNVLQGEATSVDLTQGQSQPAQ